MTENYMRRVSCIMINSGKSSEKNPDINSEMISEFKSEMMSEVALQ